MSSVIPSVSLSVVAAADLHGHPDHLDCLVSHLDRDLGDYLLVTLGDYCDNGPDVPGLLDRLIALHAERPGRVVSILGNHDLACLRSLGWPEGRPDPEWYRAWSRRFWNPGGGTPTAYGASSAAELARAMPMEHQLFLAGLPWFYDDGVSVFVHAGMEAGPLGPQCSVLAERRLPPGPLHQPRQIRDKALSRIADPSWDRVVVSAHNKHLGVPFFEGPNRICLSGEIDATGRLLAVVLPEGRVLAVEGAGRIATMGGVWMTARRTIGSADRRW